MGSCVNIHSGCNTGNVLRICSIQEWFKNIFFFFDNLFGKKIKLKNLKKVWDLHRRKGVYLLLISYLIINQSCWISTIYLKYKNLLTYSKVVPTRFNWNSVYEDNFEQIKVNQNLFDLLKIA